MIVRFQQSGGFAGLSRGCQLDTAELPDRQAKKLHSLVTPALQSAGDESAPPAGAADLTHYEIEIEGAGDPVRIIANDMSVSEQLQPLLEFLQERARPQKP